MGPFVWMPPVSPRGPMGSVAAAVASAPLTWGGTGGWGESPHDHLCQGMVRRAGRGSVAVLQPLADGLLAPPISNCHRHKLHSAVTNLSLKNNGPACPPSSPVCKYESRMMESRLAQSPRERTSHLHFYYSEERRSLCGFGVVASSERPPKPQVRGSVALFPLSTLQKLTAQGHSSAL